MNELIPGMDGIPMPYRLGSDWMITTLLAVVFILTSYATAQSKKYLQLQFKNFTSSKTRASLFDEGTASDMRYTFILIAQTCILSGVCIYDYFNDHNALLFHTIPHHILLGTYIGFVFSFLVVKWVLYSFINWIFFDNFRNSAWMEAYFNVLTGAGFLLFPIVLLMIYFNLSSQFVLVFIAFVLIIAKILLFYKCVNNFFNKIHGAFHLILYFCTLEIIPLLVLWKGIIIVNNILVLNF